MWLCVCVCVAQVEKRESHLKDINDLTQEEITGMTIYAIQHACHTLPKLTLLIFSFSASCPPLNGVHVESPSLVMGHSTTIVYSAIRICIWVTETICSSMSCNRLTVLSVYNRFNKCDTVLMLLLFSKVNSGHLICYNSQLN